ncbi:MAG: DUF6314 family protein [Bdellovibrionota bacterium]
MNGTQEYLYVFEDDKLKIFRSFVEKKGKLFMDLTLVEEDGVIKSENLSYVCLYIRSSHLCEQDRYNGVYRILESIEFRLLFSGRGTEKRLYNHYSI